LLTQALTSVLAFDLQHAVNLSLYHVNPLHDGVIPVNMDTADLFGDIFFDLRSKTLPIECSPAFINSTDYPSSDCLNGEVIDSDLVITSLIVEVDTRQLNDDYGRCNICQKSGFDSFSGLPCTPNTYFCTCGDFRHPHACNNATSVGAMDVGKAFGKWGGCSWHTYLKSPWACWGFGVVTKTGGMWYSTTEAGWCGAKGANQSTCAWRVAAIEKVVNKSCSDGLIYDEVEAYDASHDDCFQQRCAIKTSQQHSLTTGRNTSNPCWIYCFYSAVLGSDALVPDGKIAGMPMTAVAKAWTDSIENCPAIAPPTDALLPHGIVGADDLAAKFLLA